MDSPRTGGASSCALKGDPEQNGSAPAEAGLTGLRVGWGLLALSVIAWPQAWLGLGSFVLRDFGVFGYPLAHYFRESFRAGELPLWNPLNYCGLPFLAQWNTMVLYPPSLFYLLLPMPWALTAFCLLHQWAGGLGMFFLGRRWSGSALGGAVAAVAYMFNGLTQNALTWPNNIAALGWLPWVWLLVEKACQKGGRWLVGAAIAGALQMLSGAPEIILLTWLLAALFLLLKMIGAPLRDCADRAGRFALVVALIAGLSAAQLIPFYEFLGRSTRIFTLDHDQWSYGEHGWMNVFVPLMHGSLSAGGTLFLPEQGWSLSFYPGLLALALALAAVLRRPRLQRCVMLSIVLLALDLARGEDGWSYPLLNRAVNLTVFRFPVKAMLFLTVLLPPLAALAFAPANRRGLPPALLGAAAIVLATTGCIMAATRGELAGNLPAAAILKNAGARLCFSFIGTGALFVFLRSGRSRARAVAMAILPLALWLDLKTHAPGLTPTVPPELFTASAVDTTDMYPRPALGEYRFVMSQDALYRNHFLTDATVESIFLQHRLSLFDNLNLLDGVPKFGGFYSMYHFRLTYIAGALYARAPEFPAGLADFLGLGQESSRTNFTEWTPRVSAMPLVAAGQRPVFVPDRRVVAALASPAFDPRRVALFDPAMQGVIHAEASPAALLSEVEARPHEIRFRIRSSVPAIATVAQTYDENWRVEVDGKPAPLLRANYAFQAVQTPAGEHEVRLYYRDEGFRKGVFISLASLLLCGFCWWRAGGRRDEARHAETPLLDPLLLGPPLQSPD